MKKHLSIKTLMLAGLMALTLCSCSNSNSSSNSSNSSDIQINGETSSQTESNYSNKEDLLEKVYQIKKGCTFEQAHKILGEPDGVLDGGVYMEFYNINDTNKIALQGRQTVDGIIITKDGKDTIIDLSE